LLIFDITGELFCWFYEPVELHYQTQIKLEILSVYALWLKLLH